MANNRMFLVYRPTGDAVFIGKRMGFGWYNSNVEKVGEQILELYERAENAALSNHDISQDDFGIAMESGEFQPSVISKWNYIGRPDDKGLRKLGIDESVDYGSDEGI